MGLLTFLKRKILFKQNKVTFAGKKTKISCRRFGKQSETPQQFMDRNAVVCGNCGSFMFPGEKIWLVAPVTDEECAKPGVLVHMVENEKTLVGCLAWGCPPTAALMCGDLLEDRKLQFFESPLSKALNSDGPIIVASIQDYRG